MQLATYASISGALSRGLTSKASIWQTVLTSSETAEAGVALIRAIRAMPAPNIADLRFILRSTLLNNCSGRPCRRRAPGRNPCATAPGWQPVAPAPAPRPAPCGRGRREEAPEGRLLGRVCGP